MLDSTEISPDLTGRGEGNVISSYKSSCKDGGWVPSIPCPCADMFAVNSPGRQYELDVAGSSLWKVAFQGKLFPDLKQLDFKTCLLLANTLLFFITVHPCSLSLAERFMWYLSGCNSPCATSGSYLMEKSTHTSNSCEVDTEGN